MAGWAREDARAEARLSRLRTPVQLLAEPAGLAQSHIAVTAVAWRTLRRHADPYFALDLVRVWNLARCRPPLSDADILHTVNAVCGRMVHRARERAYG